MAAPTVFRWSDTGAPVLNNTAGSLIGVLDFCLPARGWVKEFSGTGKAAYRAGSGNRKYYRVLDDNSMINSSFYSALVTGYDSMTDIDTGAGWGQSGYIRKSYNDSSAKRWVCIVDEYGFAIITQPHGGTGVNINNRSFSPHYIGETAPLMPGHTSRDIIACCSQLNALNGGLTSLEYGDAKAALYCNRSLDGNNTSISCYLSHSALPCGQNVAGPGYPPGSFNNAPYNYPHEGQLLYCRNFISDYGFHSIGDYIPWLYHMAHKGGDFSNAETVTVDGSTFMVFYIIGPNNGLLTYDPTTYAAYFGAILFSLGER